MKYNSLIDSHVHLHHEQYKEDIKQVIERAHLAEIEHMITICCNFREFSNALLLAETYPEISCSIGVHPHDVEKTDLASAEKIIKATYHKKVVGIGETGLDYHYENSPRQRQITSLRIHVEASRETGLPLIIHARSADEDIGDLLEEEMAKGEFKLLMHCFSSGVKLAERIINLGGYFSFSGILTFKNAKELQQIARMIPKNKVLIETDGPYLAPVPHRGQRNEPAFLKHTAEKLGLIRGWSFAETKHITTENFYNLFKKIRNIKYESEKV